MRAVALRRPVAADTTTQVYVEVINKAWRKIAEDVLGVAHCLLKAKKELLHGEFLDMVERDLPFTVRTAQRLIAIAEHPVVGNATRVSHLPPSWSVLYELTRLPVPILEAALADGRITPSTERADVKALMPTPAPAVIDVRPVAVTTLDPRTPRRSARPVLGPPCNGLQFARMAIMDLEQIRDDDVERDQAFGQVQEWLDARKARIG